jgi:3'-phosphoadenosine 5'-phosphosulfate sulfotransferase (PAPS reductase)/FAD synthetase
LSERPHLPEYDWIVVNSSGGKDSQAMLHYVMAGAEAHGVQDRVVVLHCDLGLSPGGEPIEWPGTLDLVREHAEHYGVRLLVCKRQVRGFLEEVLDRGKWMSSTERYCTSYYKRDQGKTVLTALAEETRRGFLEQVEYRGKWMGPQQRYCTSKFKQGPGLTALTQLAGEGKSARGRKVPRILNCYGFRAEESPRRRKMEPFHLYEEATGKGRAKVVWNWLPIHHWSEDDVWEQIAVAGTRHHHAYDLGMTRLSCRFCIFAPKSQLMVSARLNPALFEEYLETERRIGHRFTLKVSLAEVKEALDQGETPGADDGAWNM